MMAKRNKIKKAGSTSRNIHKIATTLAMVPLVSMSSFLFHDSYALAKDPVSLKSLTFDLSSQSMQDNNQYLDYTNDEIWGSGSQYHLSGVVSISNSDVTGYVTSNFSGEILRVDSHNLGTSTITVETTGGEQFFFNLVSFDPAITANTLDRGQNGVKDGLDIGDIVYALSHPIESTSLAADLNQDNVIDHAEITKLLGYIPAGYANSSPELDGEFASNLLNIEQGRDRDINLSDIFKDADEEDYLHLRLYRVLSTDETTSTTPNVDVTSSCGNTQLSIYGDMIGSTTYTIIAEDQHGGSKVANLTFRTIARTNDAPVIYDEYLQELIFNNGADYDLKQLISDPDGDPLTFTITTTPIGSDPYLSTSITGNLLHVSGSDKKAHATITADDGRGGSTTLDIDLYVLNKSFYVGSTGTLKFSEYFTSGETFESIHGVGTSYETGSGNLRFNTNPSGTKIFTVFGLQDEETIHKTFVMYVSPS
ncbi:hypothetical protein EHS13_32475 [Paenibacillus psychroresistens]|uniref:Uncharacterized protein n=1 Tax=Paenibacillus psychroresistens TaxID=1778678 RepID=A0A6B8RUG0_9BACL|nr:hypothetical protein [Paenibacillus psychroresistens]QGQ99245.1 hypothetical protein EHS13_32475 [Paenibacillus psychroresistens]